MNQKNELKKVLFSPKKKHHVLKSDFLHNPVLTDLQKNLNSIDYQEKQIFKQKMNIPNPKKTPSKNHTQISPNIKKQKNKSITSNSNLSITNNFLLTDNNILSILHNRKKIFNSSSSSKNENVTSSNTMNNKNVNIKEFNYSNINEIIKKPEGISLKKMKKKSCVNLDHVNKNGFFSIDDFIDEEDSNEFLDNINNIDNINDINLKSKYSSIKNNFLSLGNNGETFGRNKNINSSSKMILSNNDRNNNFYHKDLKAMHYFTSNNIASKVGGSSCNKKNTNSGSSNHYKNTSFANNLSTNSSKSTNNFFGKNQSKNKNIENSSNTQILNNLNNFNNFNNININSRDNSAKNKGQIPHNYYFYNLHLYDNITPIAENSIKTHNISNNININTSKDEKIKFSNINKSNNHKDLIDFEQNKNLQQSTTLRCKISKVKLEKNKPRLNSLSNNLNLNGINSINNQITLNYKNCGISLNTNSNVSLLNKPNKNKFLFVNTQSDNSNSNNNLIDMSYLNNHNMCQKPTTVKNKLVNMKKINEYKEKIFQLQNNNNKEVEDNDYFDYEDDDNKQNELTKEDKAIYGNREMKNYKKIKLLGKGGCGIVWLCKDIITEQLCAVKQISKKNNILILPSNNSQNAKNEIEILQCLNNPDKNPYIMDIYSSYEDQNDIWMSVEKGGKSLSSLSFKIKGEFMNNERIYTIKKGKFIKSLFSNIIQFKLLIKKIILGIDYINKKGIIHSDIKPENILIEYDNLEKENFKITKVKIIDYGSAFFVNKFRSICSNTPEYLCPELTDILECKRNRINFINDLKKYISCVDIWSLGVTLLELVLVCPVWMSFKTKVKINGKNYIKMGLFGFKGRDGNKIKNKQIEVCAGLHKILAQSLLYKFNKSDREGFEDLVGRMLCFDYKNRITPGEVLKHGFLKEVEE